MKGQQKSPDDDGDVPIIDEGERHREYSMIYHNGAVATADDPTAITTIQSAATFSSDQPIKYLFKTEGGGLPVGELYPPSGQVTYRVIQVSDGQVDGQTDGASAVSVVTGFPATTQTVTQAVFSQSEGLEGEASETHYYYPVTDATQTTMVENVQAPETLLTQSTPTGQLYVMMSPQDVLGGTNQSKSEPPRTSRDDKRRAQHNEVERRRRDKINNWIVQLSKTIPDCTLDATKNGQVSSQSKGGILSKACDYIQELRQSNARLGEDLENLERLRMDNQLLRQEVDDWKTKNQMMRSQLRQNGIVGAAGVDPQ
ncbi:upstream stimulatory factor 1 isoform X1 [Oncorhynchus tshawytscha]|uniref:upstream stimulatory factor 1 isoform X1 n=1 Tax=Oncorhynchus tshawytscha TaxID=74940 RepID=UPI000D09AEE5|nr:upstream stimulatory factor 1 isoform X1 [Oncorhynchus tshawytscha]XP_024250621.1 upstream stimulatory factor 1 isoform X1 [Oncorhynchus tshawytscha]